MPNPAVPYFPAFHFAPERGWINDPNGLVYLNGEWHLFYQYFEPSQVDGMQWGHAVSPDLVHWQHLPPALAPDAVGQIWSGSAVVDHDDTSGLFGGRPGIVCVFTYWDPADGRQCQGLAYSRDGRRFEKFAGNPIVPQLRHLPGQPDDKDFRDPKVFWHAPSARWVMAVAGGKLRIFTSADLIHWRFESVADDLTTECPDLFEMPLDGDPARTRNQENAGPYRRSRSAESAGLHRSSQSAFGGNGRPMTKWVLSGGGRWYMLGDFDGRRFTPETGRIPFGAGPDFYATQTWNDAPDGRRIAISWLFNWSYKAGPRQGTISNPFPTGPWAGGCLTVPCELALRTTPDGPRLTMRPVPELDPQGAPLAEIEDRVVRPGAGNNLLANVRGKSLDIRLKFTPSDTSVIGLRFPANAPEFYEAGYDAAKHALFVDRRKGGFDQVPHFAERLEALLAPRPAVPARGCPIICEMVLFHPTPPLPASGEEAENTAFPPLAGGPRGALEDYRTHPSTPAPAAARTAPVSLRILLDRCSVEIFGGDGQTMLSAFVLPDPVAEGVELFVERGECTIHRLALWAMDADSQ